MLSNLATNVIVPSYEDLETASQAYATAVSDFSQTPTEANLETLRTSLREFWHTWVSGASIYEFGPAQSLVLRTAMNTWPVDENQVENNIAAGTWNLETASNVDARGLPTMDYLLNNDDAATTVASFTTGQDAANRMNYLENLQADLAGLITQVKSDWEGSYKATFEASQGTDVGSSTGFLVNQMSFDLEITKNGRLGIPIGKKSLGQILPEHVESYYGGYSASLAKAHIMSLQTLFTGDGNGEGYGFEEALDALEAQHSSGSTLSEAINAQFATILTKMDALTDPLSDQISTQLTPVDDAYNAVQQMVVLYKTDLASAMSIAITYQDSDGD
ncbi:MAG: imelysin family protein [Bacteroidota bacterium]